MCSYCGCESDSIIAELMADHEKIGLLAQRATSALTHGDRAAAVTGCAEIAALFDVHADKEEAGLFAELEAESLAVEVLARLQADHRRLEIDLALLAAGDTTSLGRVLADLVDHAEREDSDLFPAALQLLPNEAWNRITKVHRERSG